MAGNQTSDAGDNDENLEHNGTSLVAKRLVEELQDWYLGQGREELVEVVHAEEHGDGIEPGSHKSDGYRSHDRDGNHLLRAMNLLSHMSGTVKTSKGPIGIDKTDDERDAVLLPARVVDEVGKDKLSCLMGGGHGGDSDDDDQEREERHPEGGVGNEWQHLSVAVEEEGEGIAQFISDYDHPRLDHPESSRSH